MSVGSIMLPVLSMCRNASERNGKYFKKTSSPLANETTGTIANDSTPTASMDLDIRLEPMAPFLFTPIRQHSILQVHTQTVLDFHFAFSKKHHS